jgi:hypothetical protein
MHGETERVCSHEAEHEIGDRQVGDGDELGYCADWYGILLSSLATSGTNIAALLHHKRGANE